MTLQNKTLVLSHPKRLQAQGLQKPQTNHNHSPVANKKKLHNNYFDLALQKYSDGQSLTSKPTESSEDLPYNWIMSRPRVNRENDFRKIERLTSFGEIKNPSYTTHSGGTTRSKIVVKRPITFSNAYKHPVEDNGWVYKTRVDLSSKNL